MLRLPHRRQTGGLGRRVLMHRSVHPFGPDVTIQDIDERVDAGARVEVVDHGPASASVLPLAAVSPDGTVNLQPGRDAPGPQDTVVALVGRPKADGAEPEGPTPSTR